MKTLKSFCLLILLTLFYSSFSREYEDKINWLPIEEINSEKGNFNILNFEGALFNPEINFVPYYSVLIPSKFPIDEVSLVNFQYESNALSSEELNLAKEIYLNDIGSEVEVEIYPVTSSGKSYISVKFIPLIKNGNNWFKITSFNLEYTSVQKKSLTRSVQQKTFNPQKIEGTWYKLALLKDGVYKIDFELMKNWGVISGSTPSNKIAMLGNEGKMNPYVNNIPRPDSAGQLLIHIEDGDDGSFDSGDYILFYGENSTETRYNEGLNKFTHHLNHFTDTNFVFLGLNEKYAKRIEEKDLINQVEDRTISEGAGFYYHESEWINFINSGRNWAGEDFQSQNPMTFNLNLPGLISNSSIVLDFSGAVRSNTSLNNNIKLRIDNDSIGSVNYPAVSPIYYNDFVRFNDITFTPQVANENFSLTFEYTYPNSGSLAWLNKFAINYINRFVFANQQFMITSTDDYNSGNLVEHLVQHSNPEETIRVWEINNYNQVNEMAINNSNGQFSFKSRYDEFNKYIAFTKSQCFTPIYDKSIRFNDLKSKKTPEYLIVTHKSFMNQANELASLHEQEDDLNTLVVDADDIYNEFSSGRKEAPAIRDFIRYLWMNSNEDTLQYVLLFGDASMDPKKSSSVKENYIPAYQSENSTRLTTSFVSDDFFGLMDDLEGDFRPQDQLDIAIGRIPAFNQQNANSALNKIKDYYGRNTSESSDFKGNWRNKIHFVADDGDNYEHMRQAEKLSVLVDTSIQNLNIAKVYADAYPKVKTITKNQIEGAEKGIQKAFKNGGLIVNYTGHGGEYGWASERILTVNDIKQMKNLNSYPLVVTATCEFSRFDDPNRTSAGEYLYLQEDGGAIALFTTVRLVFSIPNFRLNRTFYQVLNNYTGNDEIRLGDLFKETKVQNNGGTNDRNFTLLGDPALKLGFAPNYAKTSEIQVNYEIVDTLSALSKIKVMGQIENQSDFNGLIDVSVYDKKADRTSQDNDNTGSQFEYTQQESLLALGRFEVINGSFSGEMVLPKNTRSDFGIGKITYYAWDSDQDFSGFDKSYIIGGIDSTLLSDDEGPKIELWLNDSTFNFGDAVEPQPKLIASLIDSSGINISSQDLANSILFSLNDDKSTEQVLNNIFEPYVNSYYKGSIQLNLDEIEDGKHAIKLKASDNLNNKSEAYTEFYINESAPLAIDHLLNYPNPFTNHTSFYFEPNQGGVMEVMIRIYTISGSLIKTIRTITDGSSGRVGPIDWDGTDDFGDNIGRGVYIYKLSLQKEGEKIEELNKLVILR